MAGEKGTKGGTNSSPRGGRGSTPERAGQAPWIMDSQSGPRPTGSSNATRSPCCKHPFVTLVCNARYKRNGRLSLPLATRLRPIAMGYRSLDTPHHSSIVTEKLISLVPMFQLADMITTSSSDERDRSESTTKSRRDILRAGAGAAAAAVAVSTFSGQVAAHFPEELSIDVKPHSDENHIVPTGYGFVPVAVRQTDEFDPTNEPARYRFGAPDVVSDGGGARPLHDGYPVDIDGDGRDDLLLLFPTRGAGFDGDVTRARVEWEQEESGEHGLSGTDSVTVVGHGRSKRRLHSDE